MAKPLTPFGFLPPGAIPGWLWPDAGGYRVYRGVGGITNVDFDGPVGYAQADAAEVPLAALGHQPATRYTYVLRPVRGNAQVETPDYSCRIEFDTDGAGDWLGTRPGRVDDLVAEVLSGGRIRLRWSYVTSAGGSPPEDFGVYHADGPRISPGAPQAAESYAADGEYTHTLALTGGRTYYFAVTARSASGVESELSPVIGPFVADDDAPARPAAYVSAVF